jgi:CheY-like chemotaxis protein
MNPADLNLLLADDDHDDCLFFKEALEDLKYYANLTIVNDGMQLMTLLESSEQKLPNALFLDLNMPRKNGFDCLTEIKKNQKLKPIPVIIFSTSMDPEVVNLLYERGATYYIQKPAEFSILKRIISKSLDLISKLDVHQPPKEKFVLNMI